MEPDVFLTTAIFGSSDLTKSLDGDNPDIDVLPPQNPIEKFVADRAYELALEKTGGRIFDSSWSEPVGVLEKRESSKPLGKAVRSEVKVTDDGSRMLYAYGASGELVDMRSVLREVEVDEDGHFS